MNRSADLAPGTMLAGYRIERVLGRGGMGVVYLAEDPRLGRKVALKLVLRELVADPRARARFDREARAAAAITHPNVIATYFAGEEGNRLFLVLELATGGTLKDLLARGPLPWRDAVRLGAQVARALEAIHARGLVHRDLKPANVLLDDLGNAKLSDFGVVRTSEQLRASIATRSGELVGTIDYMSPEQAEGKGAHVDARADLYSLGATLHAALSGSPPFRGAGFVVLRQVLTEAPPPLRELVPDVPVEVERLVLRLLAKAPDDRPRTASLVAEDLEALLRPGAKDGAPPRRRLLPIVAIALVVAAGAMGGAVAMQAFQRQPHAPPSVPAPPPPPAPAPAPAPVVPAPAPPPAPVARPRLVEEAGWPVARPKKVICVQFTPDGRTLLAGGEGELAALDVATRRERFVLPHGGAVWRVAASADGTRALTASYDGNVRLVDLATGRELAAARRYACAYAVAFSPSGKLAASSGDNDGGGASVDLWRIEGNELVPAENHWVVPAQNLATPQNPAPQWLRFRTEKECLGVGHDGYVHSYEVGRPEPAFEFPVNKGSWTHDFELVDGGRSAAFSCWERPPVHVSLERRAPIRTLARKRGSYTGAIAVTADEKVVVISSSVDGAPACLELLSLATGEPVADPVELPGASGGLAISREGLVAAAGEADDGRGWVKLWRLADRP